MHDQELPGPRDALTLDSREVDARRLSRASLVATVPDDGVTPGGLESIDQRGKAPALDVHDHDPHRSGSGEFVFRRHLRPARSLHHQGTVRERHLGRPQDASVHEMTERAACRDAVVGVELPVDAQVDSAPRVLDRGLGEAVIGARAAGVERLIGADRVRDGIGAEEVLEDRGRGPGEGGEIGRASCRERVLYTV